MLLDLSHIRRAEEHIDREIPVADLAGEDAAYRVLQPARVSFDVRKDKNVFRLTGTLASELELACSRCLEPYRLPVAATFDQRYLPQVEVAVEGAEHEVGSDDLDASFYREDAIDLGELVREQFYLALPMKPLCTEGCKGLCAQCGTNHNLSSCACTAAWEDPRLAPLKTLRDRRDHA